MSSKKKMEQAAEMTKSVSPMRDAMNRLLRDKAAIVCIVILIIIFLITIFADLIAPYDYAKQDYASIFKMPSTKHLFGTDNYGRDLFSRVIKGGQISLLISVLATAIAMIIGSIFGATAAYFEGSKGGNIYSTIVMRLMDVIMAMPSFMMAMTISAALGSGTVNTIIAMSISATPTFVRIMYAAVIAIKNEEFIEAAKATGAKNLRIIVKYVIPNCLAPIIVNTTFRLGASLMAIAGLSFVGLGVQPPTPEWGSIMSAGKQYIRDFWPIVVFPGLVIAITLVCFQLLGDKLRDAMDPKLKQ